jgi:hypothetical protein
VHAPVVSAGPRGTDTVAGPHMSFLVAVAYPNLRIAEQAGRAKTALGA